MHYSPLVSSVTLSLALLSSAEHLSSPYNIHEKRTHVPLDWALTRRHDPASTIPLRFALKQQNIEDVGDYLYDVSHPESPNYGKHWTAADIARTFSPSDETVDAVRSWLIASEIDEGRISLGRTKGWIQVNVTVEEAEQLMKTEYNVYTHLSGKEHVACEAYYLPEHVQPHVDFVIPSVHFDAKLTRRSGSENAVPAHVVKRLGLSSDSGTAGNVSGVILEQCNEYITPICLRTLYDLFYRPTVTNENSFGIVEYTPETYVQSDLQVFARNYSIDLIGKSPSVVWVDSDHAYTTQQGSSLHIEPNVDVQYGMSLVTGNQTVSLYQVGDLREGASFNTFLDAVDGDYCTFDGGDDTSEDPTYPDDLIGGYTGPKECGTVKPAYVISTSYNIDEAQLSPSYTQRQCTEYAKLGLMGITILYPSGDGGVAGYGGQCLNSSHISSSNGYIFNPSFPGTCPYVTSVGATMVKPNATVFDPETACSMFRKIYSGGGFSNHFGLPMYQKEAVGHYLTHYRPDHPSTIWNHTGNSRAYPDISANGANYVVAVDGKFQPIYGTSCATPVIGAIFTMVNDARLAVGKRPIGFVNTAIYSAKFASAFHDIIEGNNPGCGTMGYNATRGWDPVTGLGTPNATKLLELWLSLP